MKNKEVVVVGGGTGTFTVLSGLKKYEGVDLTAVVSTADDGGSNKKFRDEFGLLPPSDFLQAILALSTVDESNSVYDKLLRYRFSKGEGMGGQRMGNIIVAALTDIMGGQLDAHEKLEELMKVKGKIFPVTTENIRLMAEYANGDIEFGEHLIDEPHDFHDSKLRIERLFINRKSIEMYQPAKNALVNADFIILGPGDLYTSTLANVVVDGAAETIKNSKAKIVYIPNLMTKYGQTYGFTAEDHVNEIAKYVGKYPEYIMLNNSPISQRILKQYAELNDFPVKDDLQNFKRSRVIRTDLVADEEVKKHGSDTLRRSLVRHDSNKIASTIMSIIRGK